MIFSTGFRTHLFNLFKKHHFKITAILIMLGIGGVAAATNIVINSGAPISVGSGSIVATSCDEAITVQALPKFSSTTKLFNVETITVSGVNESTCGNKQMEMMTLLDGTPVFTSWTIASSSNTNGIYYFTSATSNVNSAYANTALTPNNVISFSNFALTFKDITTYFAPVGMTLTVTNGSGDTNSPITANVALRFLAIETPAAVDISMVLKSKPAGASTPTVSGGTGRANGSSAGWVNLTLTPSITPTVDGTYVFTVIARDVSSNVSSVVADVQFIAVTNSEP
jgi:hypothetical protein